MAMTADVSVCQDDGVQEADGDQAVVTESSKEVIVTPSPKLLHEAALRSGINTILDETAADDDELACIREICQETLARMDRVAAAKSLAHRHECNNEITGTLDGGGGVVNGKGTAAFAPPKSPQRLMALMPNAMEKGKARMSRRPSSDK